VNAHGEKSGVRLHDSREFRKAGSHSKSVKKYVQYYMEDTKNNCILNRFPSEQKHEIRNSVCIIEICLDDILDIVVVFCSRHPYLSNSSSLLSYAY